MPPIFTPLVSFQLAAARRRLGGNIVRNGGQPLLFQLAAARRRLADMFNRLSRSMPVSTRSRPKAAGQAQKWDISEIGVSTRSRPKAAGIGQLKHRIIQHVSTRSRPKAADSLPAPSCLPSKFQLAAARRRLRRLNCTYWKYMAFQLAAARRRLSSSSHQPPYRQGFNSQPPEGG